MKNYTVCNSGAAVQTEAEIAELCVHLRSVFQERRTSGYAWRKEQLMQLQRFLEEREEDILQALYEDFRKPQAETWFTEIHYLLTEITVVLRHLRRWMKPVTVHTPLRYQPGRSYYICEPCGVVLNIAAWNYPLQLSLAPAVAAIAAGNCLVIKPSEMAPATAALLSDGLKDYLDSDAIRVVQGGAEVTASLLTHRFDHVFFTGSQRVGRLVLSAASRHLTPVTLELGGKSPCIVDKGTDIDVAARRIVWAKYINAGQTCISPDYVLVQSAIRQDLLDALQRAIDAMYGPGSRERGAYAGIISEGHVRRLQELMKGGSIVCGGGSDAQSRYVEPTILTDVSLSSPLMQEEIFGPLLPVIAYDTPEEAVAVVRSAGDPLALYIFSPQRHVSEYFMGHIHSGGVCINDLLFQAAIPALPFGGRGTSGMGRYHGRSGFETFSRLRSVHRKGTFPENALRYPPFGSLKFKLLQQLFKRFH
ncbi:MAG: aldehyde dehydrogenase family protein [Prosthecochloris sp.]|uniref:aldehyde dehydrogenase family protein n=1 Tax=Prosthecochloris sp. TaxID=290513 RepID=UPI0013C80189|nr:aldehyde dehydrogenase family protein [Prosthecochloris sp.]NEX11089.1 aldehyde dehydrogenase family protein [Prosthecochloris sp.]